MQENNNNQINLVDLFFYLLRHWYWFFACVAVCVGFAYYRYSKMPMIYRSDATVIIKDPSNTRATVHMDNYSGLINKVSMSNEILQLKSKRLMSEVVKSLDADVSYTIRDRLRDIELYNLSPIKMFVDRSSTAPEYLSLKVRVQEKGCLWISNAADTLKNVMVGDTLQIAGSRICFQPTGYYNDYIGKDIAVVKSPVTNVAAGFLSRLKIQQTEEEGSILSLSLQDYSVHRASDVLDMLVEKYNEDAIREKNRIAVNTAAFINERLMIIQRELGEVEDDIADFKISERIMSVDAAAAQYLSESNKYSAEIVEIEAKLKLAEYLDEYLRASFQIYETIPVNTGLDDANLSQAIGQYNKLIIQREQLIRESSVDSPAVRQVESGLQSVRSNILGFITNLTASLAVSRRELIQREQESLKMFTTMPAKARELLSIERQQKIKESLYVFLLNKREENALTQAMVDNNARMIDSAAGSWTPIYPDRNKMLLVAFLIGLFVPAVILVAILFMDTKIRSRRDIDEVGDIPFLADIPEAVFKKKKLKELIKRKREDGSAVPIIEYGNSSKVFKEAMRMMCTNIDFTKPEGSTSLVLMTSSFNSGAGKSFISRNVAMCLKDADKKVVIVDVDLRKRSISSFFGMKHRTAGLSNYLVDKDLTPEHILRRNVLDGIDFIPAGHIPPNPTELLGRSRLDELIGTLRRYYDYIILDGTPVNMVADSMVVGRLVDMNLFVLRCGVSDRRLLPMVKELSEEHRLKNLSVVLNGTDIRKMYGFSYGYGYGYYGYGYGAGYYGDSK